MSLLLDTVVLSTPSLGSSQRGSSSNSFSRGEYFYSIFPETINAELLRNLDLAVLELMKSSVDNPKMVMIMLLCNFFCLNIMLIISCHINEIVHKHKARFLSGRLKAFANI